MDFGNDDLCVCDTAKSYNTMPTFASDQPLCRRVEVMTLTKIKPPRMSDLYVFVLGPF